MAFLAPLSYDQLVQNAISSYNSVAAKPANTGPNSSLGPIFNAHGLEYSGLQWQILYLNSIGRLATTTSIADAATFVAPFGLTPNPAVASSGSVTFSTSSPAPSQITISPGVLVQTADGTQFQVVADTNQGAWNPTLNAYVIGQGGTMATATVSGVTAGSVSNVLAQTINQIVSSASNPAPAGVASVINPNGFSNGSDAETVAALLARFQLYMQGRWATNNAIAALTAGYQAGITWSVGDMVNSLGQPQNNFFTVFLNVLGQNVQPSAMLLSGVTTEILANRALGMPFQVVGPNALLIVNGSVTLQLQPGADASAVISAATAAWNSYLNNIGLGDAIVYQSTVSTATTTASYSALLVSLASVSGVASIPDPPGLLINGATDDIVAPWGTQIVAGTLNITTQ